VRSSSSGPYSCPYSPECVEGKFPEVRPKGVLGSPEARPRVAPALRFAPAPDLRVSRRRGAMREPPAASPSSRASKHRGAAKRSPNCGMRPAPPRYYNPVSEELGAPITPLLGCPALRFAPVRLPRRHLRIIASEGITPPWGHAPSDRGYAVFSELRLEGGSPKFGCRLRSGCRYA
jgi:hypothetical protein